MYEGGFALWCLCLFGFSKEFRPSQSFLTPYLEGPWMNFTREQVNQEIYPIGTYSTFLLLIVVFLITDILCYKPVIIVHSIAGVLCYCLLTFGNSLTEVQAAEVFYGLFAASEVAYATYMYASCEKESYQKVTSYTRIALQVGRLLSDSLGQVLISCKLLDFYSLNFLTLAGLLCSSVFGILLPSTNRSLYFHLTQTEKRSEEADLKFDEGSQLATSTEKSEIQDGIDFVSGVAQYSAKKEPECSVKVGDGNQIHGFRKILNDFVDAFSNAYVIKWSLWWAFAQCGYLQVSYYVQNLWQDTVDLNEGYLYNGAASAVYTILAIFASWLASLAKFSVEGNQSLWLLSVCSLLSGTLITLSAHSHILVFQYAAYGIFKMVFQVMMIYANSEVAKCLTRDSHGLIFGFNTFLALIMQTILTVIVTGKGGLELPIRQQFLVYGGYYIIIGCFFGIMAVVNSSKRCLVRHEVNHVEGLQSA